MKKILELIRSDFEAKNRNASLFSILWALFFSYNMRPLILLRMRDIRVLRFFIRRYLRNKYMIEYSPNLRLGSHFRMEHPRGIILSAQSIGNNCMIGQWVTIGGNNLQMNSEGKKTPVISDNVIIYAGAVVAGPIIIGHDVVIAANATVTTNVTNNSLVYNQTGISHHNIVVPGWRGAFYYGK